MHGPFADGSSLSRPATMPAPAARSARAVAGLLVARLGLPAGAWRTATGAFWSVSGAIAARLLALAAAVGIARQLGAVSYGEYNLVLNTAGMFQALAGFGLGETATRYLSGRFRGDPAGAGRVVALSGLAAAAVGTVAASILVALAPWIARDLLGAPALAGPIRLGAALLLVGPINGALLGVLTGLERFRVMAIAIVAAAAASVPLLVLGARLGGMRGGVAGQVAATVGAAAISALAVRRVLRELGATARLRDAVREWRILFSYSLPATLSNLLVAPVTWITSAIVANQADGLRELGLFSAANQWRNAIVLVATASSAVLFPLFSRLSHDGHGRELARAFRTSLAAVGFACLAMAGALAALAPWLMAAYGPDFGGGVRVLVLLAAAGALAGPLTVVQQAIAGSGRMWLALTLNSGWACMLLGTAHALRARGALGLAAAHIAAYLVHLAAALVCARWAVLRRRWPAGAEG